MTGLKNGKGSKTTVEQRRKQHSKAALKSGINSGIRGQNPRHY
jgi:hypothetical protein